MFCIRIKCNLIRFDFSERKIEKSRKLFVPDLLFARYNTLSRFLSTSYKMKLSVKQPFPSQWNRNRSKYCCSDGTKISIEGRDSGFQLCGIGSKTRNITSYVAYGPDNLVESIQQDCTCVF